jgi:group I intron endonuclease
MKVYVIVNTVNGKQYIGQTVQDLDKRLTQHINKSLRKKIIKDDQTAFHMAIQKWGPDVWEIFELCQCSNMEELNEMEISMIAKYNTYKGRGYNSSEGGMGTIGYKHTDFAKHRIGSIWRGKKQPKDMSDNKSKSMSDWYKNPDNASTRKAQIQDAFDSKVYQYDEHMNLVKVWPSIRECKLSGAPGSRYSLKTQKHSKGYLYSKEKLH